ncbi:MAG TPA: outer membrane protein assembly factor BamA [Xanthobacteraceae bacterium]|nr:outer membrane protein assembly factor BamA [Xanthobacteraceae bacterium]
MRPRVWSRGGGAAPGMRPLCAMMLSVLAFCSAALSAPTIEVQGNRRVDAQAIREHFHASADGLTAAAIDAALKELYETGLFEDVKIGRSGARLIVTVVEAAQIERLRFEGNKQIKDKDLAKEIRLKPRSAMTKVAVREDVARIVEMYHRNGRYQVEVTPTTIARGEGRVDLVFDIREGPKTGIRRIAFVGNHEFAESRLKGVIKTTESGWFAFLKTSDVYDPDRIENDADLLRRFYVKNGFADAHVAGVAQYDPPQQGFTVTFTINEGIRYRFGAIEIQSRIAALDGAALRDVVHLAQGDIFDGEAVGKAADAIAVAAGKRGFPFVDVRPHANRHSAADIISVVFTLDDGPRRYVERINIHGNTVTRDEVIRREFDVAEGDAYNRGLIDAAERRLKQLPPFKSVKIMAEDGSTPDRVVLNVEVEEQQTGDLWFSGGYSTSAGIIGEVSASERNFLGLGQYVKVSVALGQYLRSGAVSFVEPYFLGNRMALGLDLFFKEVLANPYQSYGSESYGASIKVSAPLMDGVTSEARYSLVNQSVSLDPTLMACIPPNASTTCPSVVVKQVALDGPQWVSTVGSTLIYSSLDNPKSPHEGLRAELSQNVATLPGTVDFLRTTGDVRYYHDLGNDVVGLVRAQGGYITPYGGQTLPLMSSFFGGPQLVRGFAVNGFGPRDVTIGTTQDNIGGSRYWTTSTELQAPIPGLPPEIALKAAVFADAGSLWGYRGATSFPSLSQSLTVADSRRVRSSIGSSLIWDSPFGPLRLDYAYPTSKASTDVTQRLHFGVGAF